VNRSLPAASLEPGRGDALSIWRHRFETTVWARACNRAETLGCTHPQHVAGVVLQRHLQAFLAGEPYFSRAIDQMTTDAISSCTACLDLCTAQRVDLKTSTYNRAKAEKYGQ
jgi:hypothetical protein